MATKTAAVEAVDMAATAEPEATMIAVVAAAEAAEDTMTAEARVVMTAAVVAVATIVVAMIGTAACI